MRQETCGSSLWIVRQHTLITKITLGMTAPKNKIRPMLMREISWIGECELDEAGGAGGSSLGRCKNSGLTSAYSSYHRPGEGGRKKAR